MSGIKVASIATDAPFYRDESVRIGHIVHAYDPSTHLCHMAHIVGHPTTDGQPHPDDRVFLDVSAVKGLVGADKSGRSGLWDRFVQSEPGEKPTRASWHYIRACPWSR